MKKIVYLLLTVIMILSLSLVTFASEEDGNSLTDDSLTQDIGVDYTAGSEAIDAGTIYSVSIEWTSIGTLKYQGAHGGTYRWNPDTLKYELSGNAEASWTDASVQIDVTNKSNTGIMVQASYTDKAGDQAHTSMNWTGNVSTVTVGSAAVSSAGEDIQYTDTMTTGSAKTAQLTGTVTATGSISESTTSVGTISITLQERGDEPLWQMDGNTLTGVLLGNSTDLVIPENVTAIAANAFKDQTEITSVVIPSGVTSVAEGAFENCTGLETIGWESKADTDGINIEKDAFKGCPSSVQIYIWSVSCTGQNDSCISNLSSEWAALYNAADSDGYALFGDIPFGQTNVYFIHKGAFAVQ